MVDPSGTQCAHNCRGNASANRRQGAQWSYTQGIAQEGGVFSPPVPCPLEACVRIAASFFRFPAVLIFGGGGLGGAIGGSP